MQSSSLKPSMSMGVTSRHNRSKSDTCNRIKEEHLDTFSVVASRRVKLKDMELVKGSVEPKKEQSPKRDLQISLKREILHLEKRLQDQLAERQALEKALGYRSSSQYSLNENSIAKDNNKHVKLHKQLLKYYVTGLQFHPAQELIKEIAVLELEVVYLEQYLLSLYRKTFDSQSSVSSPTTGNDKLKSPSFTQQGISEEVSRLEITSNKEKLAIRSSRLQLPQESLTNPLGKPNSIKDTEKLSKPGIDRSQSSLAQHSAFSTSTSPLTENLAKAVRACHSQPLSFHESMQKNVTNVVSLAEHLGTRISDHIPETPNKLSEDMIKCMSAIYYKLADPPRMHNGLSSSPISSSSSINAFSPQYQYDTWSPQCRKDSSFDSRLDNPFHVEGLKEFSGPYSTMVEVPFIYTDSQRMSDVDHILQNYRSLVCRLEDVDPTKMRHEEKLAFWINIHNALVMHTFLVYGIPQNYLKRVSLLLKAAYNVGGHTISAEMIQTSILGCRMPRPSQWFRIFFSSRMKFKAGDNRQAYVVLHNEPLLYFALCSGSHSDAAVRLYTPKRLFHELEAAKEEYIRATFGVRKGHKILMSKIIESFAKDSGLCPVGVMEMIQKSMPDTLRKTIQRCQQQQQGCPRKTIEWVPHNFAFRYLLSKELVIK